MGPRVPISSIGPSLMWLFSEKGFYSIVAHRDHPDYFLVRARVRADLERLAPPAAHLIEHTPHADYPFRVRLARSAVEVLIAQQVDAIDYPNFKDRIGQHDPHREHVYHQVWSVIHSLEQLGRSVAQALEDRATGRPRRR